MKLPGFEARAAAVRQPLLQGIQTVAALWFPADWYAPPERARRLLAQWRPGATVLAFAQGDLLRFAAPVQMPCESLGGWPLHQQGRSLCSAAMTAAEAASAPAADLWLVEGGQVTALNLVDGLPVDPAHWLAVDAHALLDTFDCSAALAEAVVLLPSEARELREVLNGQIAPPSEEQRELLKALARRAEVESMAQAARGNAGRKQPAPVERDRDMDRRVLWFVALGLIITVLVVKLDVPFKNAWWMGTWALLAIGAVVAGLSKLRGGATRWISAGTQASQASTPADPGANAGAGSKKVADTLPSRRGPARLQRWRQWLARLAITTQASRLLGRRQAAYLRNMMALFESGKLEEALRHAIPLGGDGQDLGQAFGTPGPRADLSLSRSLGGRSSIGLGMDAESYLRKLYRQSFEKLDREGKVEQAVFVLAELLQSRGEALDYLEKHGRFQQAAELALAWDQPAAVIVRLHVLAGDWRRAVAVARRDNAFAGAVLQLEKKWPDVAVRLREEWAQSLAARGEWLEAIEAIWPIESRRALAVDWLLSAEGAGGGLAAAALVKRAQLLPDTLHDCAAQLEALRDDADQHDERQAMANAILALSSCPPSVATLACIIGPGLVADHAAGRATLNRQDLQRLLKLGGDALFEADAPISKLTVSQPKPLKTLDAPLQVQAPPAGGVLIHDAAVLDDGRYLVALGEAGAAVVDARGRMITRFAVPAYRIVIAHSRQMALVMAPRDQLWRVSRLDLTHRRATDLGVAELGHVANEFDGIAWTVLSGSHLRVLDTQRSLQEVLWQVPDLPGVAMGLTVQHDLEQVLLHNGDGQLELWSYQLPLRRLLSRGEVIGPAPVEHCLRLLNPNGGVIDLWCEEDAQHRSVLRFRKNGAQAHASTLTSVSPGTADALQGRAGSGWLMAGVQAGALVHWRLVSLASNRVHAELSWPASSRPRTRLQAGHVLVFDDEGRLWHVDSASSAVKELSLRP